jgi:C-terminal processing protease CtpA/Prc
MIAAERCDASLRMNLKQGIVRLTLNPILRRLAQRPSWLSSRTTRAGAILVDENSISQSEFTTMAFRASPHAIVVGGTTAGADGNISPFLLPGGLQTQISGNGTFYPDKTPTQRVGIIPDLVARPTVAGIRAGRDEVLDAAMRQILHEYRTGGPDVH